MQSVTFWCYANKKLILNDIKTKFWYNYNMIEPKKIIRTKRRTLAITINEKGELIVHAPKNMPLYEIVEFLESKRKWIEDRCNSIQEVLNKNRDIVEYNEIFFLGKRYKIYETQGIDEPYITEQALLIKPCKNALKKQNLIKQWYLKNVENILVPRVEKLAKFMKQNFASINILNSKAKWGMCDNKKNLYFNWKLLLLSPELIDYIIIHELAHLIELNHSPKFWEIVKSVLPNYKHLKEIINRCNFLIKLF